MIHLDLNSLYAFVAGVTSGAFGALTYVAGQTVKAHRAKAER